MAEAAQVDQELAVLMVRELGMTSNPLHRRIVMLAADRILTLSAQAEEAMRLCQVAVAQTKEAVATAEEAVGMARQATT